MGRVFDGGGDNRFFRFKMTRFFGLGTRRVLSSSASTAFLDRVAIAVKRIRVTGP